MKIKMELPAILLVMAMFTIAEYTGEQETIFPEIAALALGAWVMEKSPWQSTNLNFWLSPTLAAVTGIIIVRYFAYAPLVMVPAAFCLVALQLKLFRSDVLPSLSAAILPVITRAESWYYPLSVCLLTGIIALGRFALNRSKSKKGHIIEAARTAGVMAAERSILSESVHWGKLLTGVILITAVAVGFDLLFMVAPPLIVAFVEMSKPGGAVRAKMARALIVIVLAAFTGVFWLLLIHKTLFLPMWVSSCVTTITIFLLYHALRTPFPPAVAIALLPTILPEAVLPAYPWHVLAGTTAFCLLSKACFGNNGLSSGKTKDTTATEGASTC
ncbi:MAG: hypothetical protein EHM79_06430 [Geobacter sp.]|nr:MAG: hypothetical protein EHM79_06430 [Geobacter sp.]